MGNFINRGGAKDPPIKSGAKDLPVSPKDVNCAEIARAVLFDRNGTHHSNSNSNMNIHPALKVLEQIRSDAVEKRNMPFTSLIPSRRVIPAPSSLGGWDKQPDIEESTFEVIPQVLNVKCMQCPGSGPMTAFLRTKELCDKAAYMSTDIETKVCQEIVLCTNRLLKKDATKAVKAVEEALTHQLVIVRAVLEDQNCDSTCDKYAELQVMAAKAAECLLLYHKEGSGSELWRGGSLGHHPPTPGFFMLPGFLRQNLQSQQSQQCIRNVAIQETAYKYEMAQAEKCVMRAMAKKAQ
jgi:hypothetical protein